MANRRLGQVVWHLRHLVGGPPSAGVTDGQLLERFAVSGDETAFDAIMHRHGRMVLGVCRRVLHDEADVEDAFQATFLLLIRKAAFIRQRDSVGSWLHGVAYRLAVRSVAEDARRRVHEQRGMKRCAPEPAYVAAWRELQEVLDEELYRLPEKYRLPLVLCYLEGETQDEVAHRLNWPVGTVKGRLARARERLRRRLERRGLTLGAAPLATLLAVHSAPASVPPSLALATAQSAMLASGGLATGLSLRVVALADGLARSWLLTKLKLAGVLVLTVGMVAAGAGVIAIGNRTVSPDDLGSASPTHALDDVGPVTPKSTRLAADAFGDLLPGQALARLGTTRFRAGRSLYTITFSPNGEVIAAPGEDAVFLWDSRAGKEVARLHGHEGRVFPVVFTPDGKKLVTGGLDKTIRVWDVATGTELSRLEGHEGPIAGLAVSSTGDSLISGSLDKTLRAWDLTTGKQRQESGYPIKTSLVQIPLQVLTDNRTLATRDQDNVLHLWDLTNGSKLHQLDAKLGSNDFITVSPGGTVIAAAVRGANTVRRWDVTSGEELAPYKGHRGEVRSLVFSPDGNTLASSAADKTVRFWNTTSGIEERRIVVDLIQGERLAFSPCGRLLATGQDGTIRLWDVETGRETQPFDTHQSQVRMLACTPDGQTVISGGRDNTLCWWEMMSGRLITNWRGEQGKYISPIAISPDAKMVACGGTLDGVISLRDAFSGKEQRRLRGHKGSTTSMDVIFASFSADGGQMISGGFDRTMRLWDVVTGAEVRRFSGELPQISAVAYSPCGRVVAAGGLNGAVHIWNTESGAMLHVCADETDPVRALAFSPDGGALAAAHGRHYTGSEGVVNIWDVDAGSRVARLGSHAIRTQAVTYSPDGKWLATGGADCKIRIWNPRNGKEVAALDGHRGAVVALAFTPDGRHLVSGSHDTTVLVWPVGGFAN